VIPTLLTSPGSVLVHDMKSENWARTSAWRARFSNAICFNATDPEASAHFNPFFEVRRDENQIRDVQNIADLVVDSHRKGKESHWDCTADQFFLGVILHVLHAEADKSLYGVSKFPTDLGTANRRGGNRQTETSSPRHIPNLLRSPRIALAATRQRALRALQQRTVDHLAVYFYGTETVPHRLLVPQYNFLGSADLLSARGKGAVRKRHLSRQQTNLASVT